MTAPLLFRMQLKHVAVPVSRWKELMMKAKFRMLRWLGVLVSMVVAGSASATVLRVPQDYSTIQAAIDAVAAATDTVVLDTLGAPYVGPQNRGLSFAGKEFVMRSLDPLNPAIRDATVIDAQQLDRHFTFSQGEGPGAKLWGLTLRHGKAPDGVGPTRGGAVLCAGASPIIANCQLDLNQAQEGGAVACVSGSRARLLDCFLHNNDALLGAPGSGQGGALLVTGNAEVLVDRCELSMNSAAQQAGAIYVEQARGLTLRNSSLHNNSAQMAGGALATLRAGRLRVLDCSFSANHSDGRGGAAWLREVNQLSLLRTRIDGNSAAQDGGGLLIDSCAGVAQFCDIHHNLAATGGGGLKVIGSDNLEFTRCTARDNTVTSLQSGRGGGVQVEAASPTFIACSFERNQALGGGGVAVGDSSLASLRACIIDSNVVTTSLGATGSGSGGGVLVENGSADIRHCTIVENQVALSGGGVYVSGTNASLVIENSILFDNWAEQILVAAGTDTVTYSDVEGGYAGIGNIDAEVVYEPRAAPIYKYVPDVISAPVDAGNLGSGDDYINWCGLVDYGIDYWCESDSVMNRCDPDMGAYGGPDGEAWLRDLLPTLPPCS